MTQPHDDTSRPLEYASPRPVTRQPWSAAGRLGLASCLSVAHYVVGIVLIVIFNETRFVHEFAIAFLLPFGLGVMLVNPHKMAAAALCNSLCCGFLAAYAYIFFDRRRRG